MVTFYTMLFFLFKMKNEQFNHLFFFLSSICWTANRCYWPDEWPSPKWVPSLGLFPLHFQSSFPWSHRSCNSSPSHWEDGRGEYYNAISQFYFLSFAKNKNRTSFNLNNFILIIKEKYVYMKTLCGNGIKRFFLKCQILKNLVNKIWAVPAVLLLNLFIKTFCKKAFLLIEGKTNFCMWWI